MNELDSKSHLVSLLGECISLLDKCKWYVLETTAKLNNWVKSTNFFFSDNFKILCTAQKRSMRALFATAQQPHSRNIFLKQKIFLLDTLINQQEGILASKVINGTYLLGDILTDRYELDHYQLRNYENLRVPLHSTTPSIIYSL